MLAFCNTVKFSTVIYASEWGVIIFHILAMSFTIWTIDLPPLLLTPTFLLVRSGLMILFALALLLAAYKRIPILIIARIIFEQFYALGNIYIAYKISNIYFWIMTVGGIAGGTFYCYLLFLFYKYIKTDVNITNNNNGREIIDENV